MTGAVRSTWSPLADGAVEWWLFQDTADPARFVEYSGALPVGPFP